MASRVAAGRRNSHGGRPKTLVYILYKAGTCEKQNQCFSVVAKDPRKHGERAGERVM